MDLLSTRNKEANKKLRLDIPKRETLSAAVEKAPVIPKRPFVTCHERTLSNLYH